MASSNVMFCPQPKHIQTSFSLLFGLNVTYTEYFNAVILYWPWRRVSNILLQITTNHMQDAKISTIKRQ